MKKNLLLRLCLILMVAITAYSCRTDQFPENESYNNISKFQLSSKRISLDEAKHKAQLIPEINKAEAKFRERSKTNVNGKIIDYGNGVSIDTDEVIYIENGPNYHTYTFHIRHDNAPADAPVENLILSPMADGTYREVLVSYHLTLSEKEILRNGGLVDTKGKTTITELAQGTYAPLSKGMTSCGWVETYTIMGCSDVHNGISTHNASNVETWEGCKADRKPGLYMTMTYRCDFEGMTDDMGNPSNPSGSSGSSGGGSSGTGDPNYDDSGNNTSPCANGGVLNGPQDLTTDPGDGNCSGIPTQINLPLPTKETPCKILKNNDAIPELKHKMDSLKLRVTQANPDKHETLVVITKEEPSGELIYNTYVAPTSGNGYIGVSGQGTNNDIADIHNHPPNTIPIFAFGDIVNIYDSYKFLYPNRKQVFVSYLVNFNGTTYAIKINDTTALDALFAGMNIGTSTTTKAQRKLATDEVLKIFKENGQDDTKTYNQVDAEKLFMKVINDSRIGSGSGIHIYRKDTDGWGKLNTDSNGNVTKENCPL